MPGWKAIDALSADLDADGLAAAPSAALLEHAERFARELMAMDFTAPFVYPTPTGGVSLEWDEPCVDVHVEPDGRVEATCQYGSGFERVDPTVAEVAAWMRQVRAAPLTFVFSLTALRTHLYRGGEVPDDLVFVVNWPRDWRTWSELGCFADDRDGSDAAARYVEDGIAEIGALVDAAVEQGRFHGPTGEQYEHLRDALAAHGVELPYPASSVDVGIVRYAARVVVRAGHAVIPARLGEP